MYCRRCGKKLEDGSTSCPACGTEVVEVKQRPYAEKYREQRQAERDQRARARAESAAAKAESSGDELAARQAAGIERDPYLLPATLAGAVAFGLSMFPWPVEWGVGTSLWMKLCILGFSVVTLVLCVLATRIESENVRKAQAYSKGHKKRAFEYAKPRRLMVAQLLCGFSALMAMLSLFAG